MADEWAEKKGVVHGHAVLRGPSQCQYGRLKTNGILGHKGSAAEQVPRRRLRQSGLHPDMQPTEGLLLRRAGLLLVSNFAEQCESPISETCQALLRLTLSAGPAPSERRRSTAGGSKYLDSVDGVRYVRLSSERSQPANLFDARAGPNR